jgi:hypothetical protein
MLSLAMTLGARAADDKTYVMKMALATLDDALHQYAKNYAAAVEKDSGGRIKADGVLGVFVWLRGGRHGCARVDVTWMTTVTCTNKSCTSKPTLRSSPTL